MKILSKLRSEEKNLCSLMYKLPVDVDHSSESLKRRLINWTRELRDGRAVLLERGRARGGHMMA